jgi:hypothetical protein
MMVMMMAMTPSLKASSLLLVTVLLPGLRPVGVDALTLRLACASRVHVRF